MICGAPKGTKAKTAKHEKPMFSFGFQWFLQVQRWLQAMKMSLFCEFFAGLFLECPCEWFWTTFGSILEPFSIGKPLKNEDTNDREEHSEKDLKKKRLEAARGVSDLV